jgi:hypothetical protein
MLRLDQDILRLKAGGGSITWRFAAFRLIHNSSRNTLPSKYNVAFTIKFHEHADFHGIMRAALQCAEPARHAEGSPDTREARPESRPDPGRLMRRRPGNGADECQSKMSM